MVSAIHQHDNLHLGPYCTNTDTKKVKVYISGNIIELGNIWRMIYEWLMNLLIENILRRNNTENEWVNSCAQGVKEVEPSLQKKWAVTVNVLLCVVFWLFLMTTAAYTLQW